VTVHDGSWDFLERKVNTIFQTKNAMRQRLAHISLVVRDYDEAIRYYTDVLGFELLEDTVLTPEKRWVRVRPRGSGDGCALLLARAANGEQMAAVGRQTGGRVFLFLHTDDFDRDYEAYRSRGVRFVNGPRDEAYGRVGVFADLYGNLWDLIGPASSADASGSNSTSR
jgi:catechol 2,3-dioxygenase-like lactoylglutathione lyase family enzyme